MDCPASLTDPASDALVPSSPSASRGREALAGERFDLLLQRCIGPSIPNAKSGEITGLA